MSEKRQPEKNGSAASLWLWVGLAFLGLVAMWVVLIIMAVKNAPQQIEASPPPGGPEPTSGKTSPGR